MRKNSPFRLCLSMVAASALLACGSVQAAITCSVSSSGFTAGYRPTDATTNITLASLTVSCTRSLSSDALSQSVTVTVNNGLWNQGPNNRAALGASRISYDLFMDSACGTQWKGTRTLGATINFSSSTDFFSKSQNIPFWGCIGPGQNVAAGTYTDTVTMNPSNGPNATFNATIITPAMCSVSTPPGNMAFNYSSFQSGNATASSNFATSCSKDLPYTMALDATAGTLMGLSYTLNLSASSAVGTGATQNFTIDGSLAGGQAGICAAGSCSSAVAHTLTITY